LQGANAFRRLLGLAYTISTAIHLAAALHARGVAADPGVSSAGTAAAQGVDWRICSFALAPVLPSSYALS
jgi:hypothetical protein